MNIVRKLLDLGLDLKVAPSDIENCAKVLASSPEKMSQRLNKIKETYPNASIVKIDEEFGMGFYTIKLGDDTMITEIENKINKYKDVTIIGVTEDDTTIEFTLYDHLDKPGNFEEDIECILYEIQPLVPTNYTISHKYCDNEQYWNGEEMEDSNLMCTITIKKINDVISMDITKQKDNQTIKTNKYVDSELLRDNFMGTDEQLQIIAQTIYECCDGVVPDDGFMDYCYSMLDCDYDYLKPYQRDEIIERIKKIINGEL